MILYLAIIFYILSLIIGIFLMATVKVLSPGKFFIVAAFHIIFILVYLFTKNSAAVASGNISFLLFICTGIILAGLAWRTTLPLPLKIYCSLFSLTLLMFLFSPSRLMVFLVSGRYTDSLGTTFPLKENYFLEQQNTSSSAVPCYKLIKKHGMFHEAIQRDIYFKGKLDSIQLVEFIPGSNAIIRGYSGKQTYVSTDVDSLDVEVKLVKKKANQIERKL